MTNTTHITARAKGKIVFTRDGKVYSAYVHGSGVTNISSMGSGSGNFRTFTRERCPQLYADIEAVLAQPAS